MWSIVFSPTAKSSEQEGGIVTHKSTMFCSFHRGSNLYLYFKKSCQGRRDLKKKKSTFTLCIYYIYLLQIWCWTFSLQVPKWQNPAEKTAVMTHLNSLHLFPGGSCQAPVQWERWYQGSPLARMLREIEE